MNEKLIERKLYNSVKKAGGIAIKFTSPSMSGVPDRIVLMPGGRVWFAELKTTGEKLRPIQVVIIGMLRKLGFSVWVIDTQELLDEFLKEIC